MLLPNMEYMPTFIFDVSTPLFLIHKFLSLPFLLLDLRQLFDLTEPRVWPLNGDHMFLFYALYP